MSAHRVNTVELGRLLNSANEPIYVLDDDLTIVFLNRACQEWLGEFGRGDSWLSMCVPLKCCCSGARGCGGRPLSAAPECWPASPQWPRFRARPTRGLNRRRARFLPLASGSDTVFAVIAVLEAADSPHFPNRFRCHRRSTRPRPRICTSRSPTSAEEAAARYRADRLIGHGPAMRLARRQMELAVGSRSNVLLVGPPGSGRQHLATAIHYGTNWLASSLLLAAGLIPLDCSLLAADLLDFLIAAIAKINALGESAGSGTMLFSRIDELSADVQTELALMLGQRTLPLRLIATAAQPLLELARRGMFRDDLAAMLSTIVIELPSLAQRRDDLPLLAQLFLEEMNASATAASRRLYGGGHGCIGCLPMAGQSRRTGDRGCGSPSARRTAPRSMSSDLPEKLHWVAQAAAHPRRTEETIALDEYLARVERELIRRALARCGETRLRRRDCSA